MAKKSNIRRVKAEPKTDSTGILILGMHRSGTSATAGVLPILGVSLGERMVPAAADNPSGYWEHAQIVTVHERLLAALRRTWEDVRPLPANWLNSEPANRAEAELAELIDREFSGLPLWGAKDPRMIRFLPLWCRMLDKLGISAKFLIVVRDPEEVAASLAVRDGIAAGHARLLWLQHLVEAEAATRQRPRAMIDYASLLAEPEKTLQEVGTELAIAWPRSPSVCRDELIAFLDVGQRHHERRDADNCTGKLVSEARATYASCMEKLRGESAWVQIAGQKPAVDSAVAEADWISGLADALSRCREGSASMDMRLAATDKALQEVTTQSLQRLDHMHKLETRMQATDRALQEVTSLSLSRLEQVNALEARVQQTDHALQEVTELSLSRLEQMHALEARVQQTDHALQEVTELSLSRLEQMHALEARVQQTDQALAEVTELSLSRLEQMHALEARVQLTDQALAEVTALSLARLDELQEQAARLDAAHATLEQSKQVALEQQEQVAQLSVRINEAEADALMQREYRETSERHLAEILDSRSWRLTSPLRAITGVLSRLFGRGRAQ